MGGGILRERVAPSRVAQLLGEGVRVIYPAGSVGVYSRVPLEHGPPAVPRAGYRILEDSGVEAVERSRAELPADVAFLVTGPPRVPREGLGIGLLVPHKDYRTLSGYPVPVHMAVGFNGKGFELEHAEPGFEPVWDYVVKAVTESSMGEEQATLDRGAAQA